MKLLLSTSEAEGVRGGLGDVQNNWEQSGAAALVFNGTVGSYWERWWTHSSEMCTVEPAFLHFQFSVLESLRVELKF